MERSRSVAERKNAQTSKEQVMKLYILRWNPTFSMQYQNFESMMEFLKNDSIDDFEWSIYDHEELEAGDMFILAQVGTGEEDGIAGFGIFNSEPYTAANWRDEDGTNRFYAEMTLHCLIDRRKNPLFCAKELEEKFPAVDWHGGHSGVLIPEDTVEPLILHLMKNLLPLKSCQEKISFTEEKNENPLRSFFAQYINDLCPNFKKKIIDCGKFIYRNFKEGETLDKDMIEISTEKFNKVKLTKDSSEEDFVKFFVAVA